MVQYMIDFVMSHPYMVFIIGGLIFGLYRLTGKKFAVNEVTQTMWKKRKVPSTYDQSGNNPLIHIKDAHEKQILDETIDSVFQRTGAKVNVTPFSGMKTDNVGAKKRKKDK